jgi:hypothetical protein
MADGGFVVVVEDIPHKLVSQDSDKIGSSSAATKRIELDDETIAPPQQGTSSPTSTTNADFNLTVPKVEDPDLLNLSENRYSAEKIEKSGQKQKSRTSQIFVCMDSTNCINQSCSMLDGDKTQKDTNADCSDEENHVVRGISGQDSLRRKSCVESCGDKLEESMTNGEQNRQKNPKLYVASNESIDETFTDGAELGGYGLVPQQNNTGVLEIDTNDDDNNITRDKRNPQHYCIGPRKISGIVSNPINEPMDLENNDTILIPQGNEVIEPHQ